MSRRGPGDERDDRLVRHLAPRTRSADTAGGGGGKTERSFVDFTVDGLSLFELMCSRGHDCITPLGWGNSDLEAAALRRLRLEDERSLNGDREPIFVCAECGEIGCGAVTARITADKGLVHWAGFGWETTWEDGVSRDGYEAIGPFAFEFRLYRATLVHTRE